MSNPKLILASESPYRRALLDRLGVSYTAHPHRCDERALPMVSSLDQHAVALAEGKARSLATEFPDAFIIGSDQIAELAGQVLHKPGTVANARDQLRLLQGRAHRLLTAIALLSPDNSITTSLDVHQMYMRSLSTSEIDRYLAADSPLDCCGSYKIECLGISLFERIEGEDFTAITGLPLISLANLLRGAGFRMP